jgi:hypothetical protein
MKLSSILLGVAVLAAGTQAGAQDREAAIAAIRNLGGQVTADAKNPEAGVAVVLTGSARPAECLPLLKDLGAIHTCDL